MPVTSFILGGCVNVQRTEEVCSEGTETIAYLSLRVDYLLNETVKDSVRHSLVVFALSRNVKDLHV